MIRKCHFIIRLFLTLSNKVEKFLCIRIVCLFIRSLTLVYILQVSWNSYMLFICDIEWTVLKMVYIRLMFVYRHTQKFSDTFRPIRKNCLKRVLTCLDCTKYNEIKIGQSHVQKYVSNKKWYKKCKYCKSWNKSFKLHSTYREEFLKSILTYLYSTKYNEINICHLDVQNDTSKKNIIKSINVLYTSS